MSYRTNLAIRQYKNEAEKEAVHKEAYSKMWGTLIKTEISSMKTAGEINVLTLTKILKSTRLI